MQKKGLIKLALLLPLVSSCAGGHITYPKEDYSFEMQFVEGFTICQLNDIHLSTSSNLDIEFEYLRNVIYSKSEYEHPNESSLLYRPNLLVLNGDTFQFANKEIVVKLFDFLDSLKIPYCFTYGNHDYQGNYAQDFIANELFKRQYNDQIPIDSEEQKHFALYKDPNNDDVYGHSNYLVNLTYLGNIQYQIYIFDSNSYVIGDYDRIHDDQVSWYERMVLSSNGYTTKPDVINDDTFAKSLAFFHIPTEEFKYAIDDYKANHPNGEIYDGYEYCDAREDVCCSSIDSNLVEKMQELRSTVSIGAAHDHVNQTDLWYKGDSTWPIRLIYGSKSAQGIYHDDDQLGAVFYTLKETPLVDGDKTFYFDLTRMHVTYEGEVSKLWPRD